jgi:hypothetical protein
MSHCKGTVTTTGGVAASQTLPPLYVIHLEEDCTQLLLKGQDSRAVGIFIDARGQNIKIIALVAGEAIVGLDFGLMVKE